MNKPTFYLRTVDGQPEAYILLERGLSTCRVQRISAPTGAAYEGCGPWTIARDRLEAEFTETQAQFALHAHMGWAMRGMHRAILKRGPGHEKGEPDQFGNRAGLGPLRGFAARMFRS